MKIETPSIRRVGNRTFFLGACGVFCALVVVTAAMTTRVEPKQVEGARLSQDWGCRWDRVNVVRFDVGVAENGVCRIRAEGIDCFVALDDVVARVSELTTSLRREKTVAVVLCGEEFGKWGEIFEVWRRLQEVPRVRAHWDLMARRTVLWNPTRMVSPR